MSITHEPERLVEKEKGVFYATDYTGYMVTKIDNKFDFPLIVLKNFGNMKSLKRKV